MVAPITLLVFLTLCYYVLNTCSGADTKHADAMVNRYMDECKLIDIVTLIDCFPPGDCVKIEKEIFRVAYRTVYKGSLRLGSQEEEEEKEEEKELKEEDYTKVAIKTVDLSTVEYEETVARSEREIRVLFMLRNHPHILQIHKAFKFKDTLIACCEWLDGGSLLQFSKDLDDNSDNGHRNKEMPMRIVLAVVRQALRGLNTLHQINMTHRDIKPANIMLSSTSGVKLIDFGMTTAPCRHWIKHQHPCGTMAFMAPEMMLDRDGYDTAADVYSFGVTMLSLVRAPYPGEHQLSEEEFFRKLAQNKGPWPDNFDSISPNEYRQDLALCLLWAAEHRPTCAQLLSRPYLNGQDAASDEELLDFVKKIIVAVNPE